MKPAWPAVAGVAVVALGTAGLIRGAVSLSAAAPASTGSAAIVVSGAYVRPPVPPATNAAAYFTIFNTTSVPDTLISVASGAGAQAVLHTVVDGKMTAISGGFEIPANGSLKLSVSKGHVMISKLFGKLTNGQYVNLQLVFANAGPIEVVAPVVTFGSPLPPGASK